MSGPTSLDPELLYGPRLIAALDKALLESICGNTNPSIQNSSSSITEPPMLTLYQNLDSTETCLFFQALFSADKQAYFGALFDKPEREGCR